MPLLTFSQLVRNVMLHGFAFFSAVINMKPKDNFFPDKICELQEKQSLRNQNVR